MTGALVIWQGYPEGRGPERPEANGGSCRSTCEARVTVVCACIPRDAVSARIAEIDPFARLGQVFEVYCAALDANPSSEDARRWRDSILPRHAAREDFRLLVAVDEDDLVIGFGYGYTGTYGQWWTDRVAKEMDEGTRRAWLDPPHYEVVELHVRPESQRSGVGSRLLDALLSAQPHERALLSTDPESPAAAFYRNRGWQRVGSLRVGTRTKAVLGKSDIGSA